MKEPPVKFWNSVLKTPARFFGLAALIVWVSIWGLSTIHNKYSWSDILVEAHGMLFDLLVFGIVLSIYDAFRRKIERIQRYEDEMDDFKEWGKREGTLRIVGNLKRIRRETLKTLNLSGYSLKYANLKEMNFPSWTFNNVNFDSSTIKYSNFFRAKMDSVKIRESEVEYTIFGAAEMHNSNLSKSKFIECDFHSAYLHNADLQEAEFIDCDFMNTKLDRANLVGVRIRGGDFRGTTISGAKVNNINWLQELEGKEIKGMEYIIEKYEVIPYTYLGQKITGLFEIVLRTRQKGDWLRAKTGL